MDPQVTVVFIGGPIDGYEERYPAPLPPIMLHREREEVNHYYQIDRIKKIAIYDGWKLNTAPTKSL